MRIIAVAAAALLASATAAQAATVMVQVGPELQRKAETKYGVAEIQSVADDLRQSVERRLARSGSHPDARIDLVLTDVKPNRPTFHQLGRKPGLSFSSFGVGGAAIEGRVVHADGSAVPVSYRWYETDIRNAYGRWTWHDAEWAFDRFAARLARGQQLAAR